MQSPTDLPSGPRAKETTAAAGRRGRPLLPARPSVLAAVFVSKSLAALLVGLPLSWAVAQVVGGYPRADATLWDEGGVMLMETIRLLRPSSDAIVGQSALLTLLATFALLLPLGALIASQSPAGSTGEHSSEPRFWRLLGRAAERFGTLALLQGFALVAQLMLVVLVVLLFAALAHSLGLDPKGTDLVGLAALAAALLAVAWLSIVHDLARVAAVHGRLGLFASVEAALGAFRASPMRVGLEASGRGALALVLLVAAGWAAAELGCATDARLVGTALAQHAAVLGTVLLRASWLGWAAGRLAH